MRNTLLLILAIGLLGACTRVNVFGRTVKDDPAPTAQTAASAARDASAARQAELQIARFALEFTPAAQQQVDADERFNSEALRDAIVAELRSRKLFDPQKTGTGAVAVIQLDEFSVRAISNVVLFGRLPSAGVLGGAIRVREAAGGATIEFHVRSEIALEILRNGTDRNPLQDLYAGFAKQFVAELAVKEPRQPQRQ